MLQSRAAFKALRILAIVMLAALVSLEAAAAPQSDKVQETSAMQPEAMQLGAFSISLAVQDIHASKDFYEKLGFTEVGGNLEQNWLILRSGTTTVGLFQGMFEKNIMTFNPGWDGDQNELGSFDDVRAIQKRLKDQGLTLQTEADLDGEGPASFVLVDPDGNPILIDQHVGSPSSSSE